MTRTAEDLVVLVHQRGAVQALLAFMAGEAANVPALACITQGRSSPLERVSNARAVWLFASQYLWLTCAFALLGHINRLLTSASQNGMKRAVTKHVDVLRLPRAPSRHDLEGSSR